jgi:hypothetical protein
MMHPCCLNPLLSAHKALEGTFLFDPMPMALLGTEVLMHQNPANAKLGVIMPPEHGTLPMLLLTTVAFVSS